MKKIFSIFLFIAFFIGACKVDNTQKIFSSIEVSSENHSFSFMLASNQNYFSTLAQEGQFNAVFNNQAVTVDASKIDGFIAFPNAPSVLNNEVATAFMSLYDGNGDNTFTFYPNVYENLTSHSVIYSDWKNAMKSTYNSSSVCSIGTKSDNFGKNINIYVKTTLNANIDSTINVAVYIINESVVATQDTSLTNNNINYVHHNVLMGKLGDSNFGSSCKNKSSGSTNNSSFSYNVPDGVDRSNLKFVAVVFEMWGGKPKRVLNCRTIKL